MKTNKIEEAAKQAKKFLQKKYPQMRGYKWDSNPNINDNWIAEMMGAFALSQLSDASKEEPKGLDKEELAVSIFPLIPNDIKTNDHTEKQVDLSG